MNCINIRAVLLMRMRRIGINKHNIHWDRPSKKCIGVGLPLTRGMKEDIKSREGINQSPTKHESSSVKCDSSSRNST